MTEVYLIVGLGNPGREYRNSRHNIGFMVIDAFAAKMKVSFSRVQFNSLVTSTTIADKKVILAKPQTYMNLSGKAVHALLRFYKIEFENLIVVNDDLDLPVGMIRIRPGGGSGGQKGIGSIIDSLGSQDFARLRIGIGRPPGQMDPADYVLEPFIGTELTIVEQTINTSTEILQLFVEKGLVEVMNKFNGNGFAE